MSFISHCIKLASDYDKSTTTFQEKESSKRKMRKQINSLEIQVSTLENAIKDELYKAFMEKLGEPLAVERYKKENKKLRQQIKSLKEIIKESNA